MKFKDKDGNVFEDISRALTKHCYRRLCSDCVFYPKYFFGRSVCGSWAETHPAEAARLMGYEVVEDDSNEVNQEIQQEEANMGKQKPRICEVLGIEVGERFSVDGFPDTKAMWIGAAGTYFTEPGQAKNSSYAMMYAIQHPESIIRKPRFTGAEACPPPKTMTGRGSREKRDIHRRLAGYRAANGLGCYEALAKAAGGKLSADEIRMMALGEAAFPLNKWMALGSALERIGANEGNRHHDGGH